MCALAGGHAKQQILWCCHSFHQLQVCLAEVQKLSTKLKPHAAGFENFLDGSKNEDPVSVLATW